MYDEKIVTCDTKVAGTQSPTQKRRYRSEILFRIDDPSPMVEEGGKKREKAISDLSPAMRCFLSVGQSDGCMGGWMLVGGWVYGWLM